MLITSFWTRAHYSPSPHSALWLHQRAKRGAATIKTNLPLGYWNRSVSREAFSEVGHIYSTLYFVYYVYIFRLQNNSLYIGFSSDLKQRIRDHRKGGVYSTRYRKFSSLVYYTAFESKLKALKFEKYLKSSSGFAFRN